MPPIGNDIVDLRAPGNPGKSADSRFRGRVFNEEEQSLISGAPRPDALLWALWASKEAAYKAVSRGNPAVCSIPRQYRVVVETVTGQETAGLFAGKVITPKGELALRAMLTSDWVHALVTGSDTDFDRMSRLVESLDGNEDPPTAVRSSLLREIALKGKVPTNLAFGGADGKTVYVTQKDGRFIEAFRVDRPGREPRR